VSVLLALAFCQESPHKAESEEKPMDKIPIDRTFHPYAGGSRGNPVNGKNNFMTVGWCARANANPPMILCGIGNYHYTPKGIAQTKTFSVNIPSSDLLEKNRLLRSRFWRKYRQVPRL